MLPQERKVVTLAAVISVLRMFTLFSILPVLALYAETLAGATPLLIGIAVGGYGLTQAVLQIPFGALSDRIGRRPVILLGLIIFGVGSVIAGSSDSIHGVIVGRFLQGGGAIAATLTALIADHTREEVRTRSMAILGITIGSTFLLAFIFGPALAAMTGIRSLFWLAAVAAGASVVALMFLPGGGNVPAAAEKPGLGDAFRPALLRWDAYIFLLHAVLTSIFVALPFVLKDLLQLEMQDQWKVYVGALLLSLAGTVPLVIADERTGKKWTFSIAIMFVTAGLAALMLIEAKFATVLGALALFFAGFNFLEAGLPARVSIEADAASRGAAMGVFSSSAFLGAFVGGIVGGLLLGEAGDNTIFAFSTVVCVLWLVAHQLTSKAAKTVSRT